MDAIVRDFAKYVYDNAESIAAAAHSETGLGVYEDKVAKAKGKARVIWNNLKGKKSRGIIGEDDEANLIFVAKPMGVVAAVCPVTNPIVTPMCNAMFALKAGNAVIFAPHPKAEAATRDLTRAYREILKRHGAPEDLVQMVTNGSVETTQALMKAADVVVATGGGAMVKAAYSSGKPSYGVGAGNVPVIIDRDVDLKDAVEKIVAGASFDNGIICSHEQFVLTPDERYEETIEAFLATGKVWFTADKSAGAEAAGGRLPGWPPEQRRGGQVGARNRSEGGHRRSRRSTRHPGAGRRVRDEGPFSQGEALPGGRDLALSNVRGGRRACESQPAGRRGRALGGAALEQRGAHPRTWAWSCRSAASS